MAPRGLLDIRAAQVQRDQEVIEEILAVLVQWVHAVSLDSQALWDRRVHKDPTDSLCPESLVAKDQREILEIPAWPVDKVLPGHAALWAPLDQVEHGGHQARRDHLDQEARQGPWVALVTRAYQELLENQANRVIQEIQDPLALKERKEKGETLRPRT